MIPTDKNFKKIAKSFYGCDGGNLASDFWFCGLEWGQTLDELPIQTEVADHGYKDTESKIRDFTQNVSWSNGFFGAITAGYNQKICWFLNYFNNLDPEDKYQYIDFVKEHKVCYNEPDGLGFKMNLFPLNFPKHNEDWNQEIGEYTGFNNRLEYEKWCLTHRSELFMQLIQQHQPKYIICTGKTSKEKFFKFFGCEHVSSVTKSNEVVEIDIRRIPNTETNVIVTAFFGGPSGINSLIKMASLAELIRESVPID